MASDANYYTTVATLASCLTFHGQRCYMYLLHHSGYTSQLSEVPWPAMLFTTPWWPHKPVVRGSMASDANHYTMVALGNSIKKLLICVNLNIGNIK